MSAAATADTLGDFESALAAAGVRDDVLDADTHAVFARDGYVILRQALPAGWLEPLRHVFESSIPAAWPFPRERGTRFSMVLNNALVRRTCLLPPVLAAVGGLMERRFYLAGVQGRDPELGGGMQKLHRDWLVAGMPTCVISGFAFLDDFDAGNGATRIQPGTHRDAPPSDDLVVSGQAGDILLLDSRVLHCGTANVSGRTRRSLHMTFKAHEVQRGDDDEWDLSTASPLERVLLGADA